MSVLVACHRYDLMTPLQQFKDAIRNPYSFPGGYEKAMYLSDGERICRSCCVEEWREIVDAHIRNDASGWKPMVVGIRWEGPDDYCCQCNEALPSEYGDPDAEE